MQDFLMITGMILNTLPIGEYDRRVVILSKEKGKISAFAKGARRQNSRLMAATHPFSFGEFKLYAGRSAYNLVEASITNYFEELRTDYEAAYYGMYFLEVMDYYTRENNDDKELLKLLYQSLRALSRPSLKHELIRYIFELKAMVVNGEFPGVPDYLPLQESTLYAVQYIVSAEIGKLYTFTVSEEVLTELKSLADDYRKRYLEKQFKSLEILKGL